MDVKQIKPTNRHNASRVCSLAKFQLLGVATLFALLLFTLNNEHQTKKGLVRRKSVLLESVRTLKEAKQEVESKLQKVKLEVEEKIKQLAETKKEMEGYKNLLKTQTKSVNEKDAELEKLRKTATEAQKSLADLKRQIETKKQKKNGTSSA